jgi:ankyrin repeat protein
MNEHPETVRVLLGAGADMENKDSLGTTALIVATMLDDPETLQVLLEAGADRGAKTGLRWPLGTDALTLAMMQGNKKVLALLEASASTGEMQSALDQNLMMAACDGDADKVKRLMREGATVDGYKNDVGDAALACASIKGDAGIVQVLLEGGADTEVKDMIGHTALLKATCAGHAKTVQVLLDAGADKNITNDNDETLLEIADDKSLFTNTLYSGTVAVRNLFSETVAVLEAAGAPRRSITEVLMRKQRDEDLFSYAGHGHMDEVKRLLGEGAPVNGYMNCNNSSRRGRPLIAASSKGHTGIMQVLLDAGANVEAREAGLYRTALISAANFDQAGAVQLLLEAGADIDAKDKDGRNAINWACEELKENTAEIVEALLQAGADPLVKDNDGDSALDIARENGFAKIVALLEAGVGAVAVPAAEAPLGSMTGANEPQTNAVAVVAGAAPLVAPFAAAAGAGSGGGSSSSDDEYVSVHPFLTYY